MYMGKLHNGTSKTRVKKIHVTLSHALKDAVRLKYISVNPASDIKPPKQVKQERRDYTKQVQRLLTEALSSPYEPAFVLPATVGLRRGEVFGLRGRANRRATYRT